MLQERKRKMHKLGKYLVVALLPLLLASCQLFSADGTPALKAHNTQGQIANDMFESFEAFVNKAEGLSTSEKSTLLDKLKEEKNKFAGLGKSIQDYILALGSVDWKDLAKDSIDIWDHFEENK